jgi:hypothetical protein
MVAAAGWRHLPFTMPLREVAALANPALAASGGPRIEVGRDLLVFAGAIHLAVGGFFGALFGLLARAGRLRGRAAVGGGLLYGLGVMAMMTVVVLPAEPISDLPARTGWATFTAAHLLFGLVLGLWVLVRPTDVLQDLTVSRTQGGGGQLTR